jgi:thiol-disulfide isomerase/thioredoxin
VRTPRKRGGLGAMQIPIMADVTKEISASYGTLLKDAGIALRGLFIIDPKGTLQQVIVNNLGVGRDVDETLRLLAAYQFVAEHGEVCPAGWKPGAATMVPTADGSQSYFQTVADGAPEDDFTSRLPALSSEAEFNAAVAGPGPVVVDWYATWCGKCRQIAPHVDALLGAHPGVKFYKVTSCLSFAGRRTRAASPAPPRAAHTCAHVCRLPSATCAQVDTDALPELAAKHGAQVLPTFSFYKARARRRPCLCTDACTRPPRQGGGAWVARIAS